MLHFGCKDKRFCQNPQIYFYKNVRNPRFYLSKTVWNPQIFAKSDFFADFAKSLFPIILCAKITIFVVLGIG